VPQAILSKEPWLGEHIGKGTSVTELEILHGVLNDSLMNDCAFFYFRDPKYPDKLPKKNRKEIIERDIPEDIIKFGKVVAARLTKEGITKLNILKKRIHESGLHRVENYSEPEVVANLVHIQFIKLIDQLFPKESTPNLLEQEKMDTKFMVRDMGWRDLYVP
jgi:hypothetical protein